MANASLQALTGRAPLDDRNELILLVYPENRLGKSTRGAAMLRPSVRRHAMDSNPPACDVRRPSAIMEFCFRQARVAH